MLQNYVKVNNHSGIKFNTAFNQIPGFHVCAPVLPPCIDLNIFEVLFSFVMLASYMINQQKTGASYDYFP